MVASSATSGRPSACALRHGPSPTVNCSRSASAEVERLQFTVGEGPCLSAHAEDRAVVADETTIATRWPAFYDSMVARTPVRGCIALPLQGELRGIGALDLYVVPPRDIATLGLHDALVVADEVAAVLRAQSLAARRAGGGPTWVDAPATDRRAIVWQAMGFVNAGLEVDSTDALAILRGYAYAEGQDVDEVARQVVDRELPLERLGTRLDSAG